MATDKLTDKAIRAAKTKPKDYKLADGGGMYLLVRQSGAMKVSYLLRSIFLISTLSLMTSCGSTTQKINYEQRIDGWQMYGRLQSGSYLYWKPSLVNKKEDYIEYSVLNNQYRVGKKKYLSSIATFRVKCGIKKTSADSVIHYSEFWGKGSPTASRETIRWVNYSDESPAGKANHLICSRYNK